MSGSRSRWVFGLVPALVGGLLVVFASAAHGQTDATGGTVVQQQNAARRPVAISGPARTVNGVSASAGPSARSLLGRSQAQQTGNNTTIVSQDSTAKSGDAVAGSQVTGVVGGGDTVVQSSNSSVGAVAVSGRATAVNVASAGSGPSARSVVGGASAQQAGNNTTTVDQSSDAQTGDAVAGSQVTGVVGGGSTVVQNQNRSIGALALSGPAFSTNLASVTSGPSAFALLGIASVSQVGNNDAILTQSTSSKSGDALAGSQSTGVVGGGGFIGGSNFAVLPFAQSGRSVANNLATGGPGPSAGPTLLGSANASQAGNNSATLDQRMDSVSGDALSGSQVNGLVGQERGALAVSDREGIDVPIT